MSNKFFPFSYSESPYCLSKNSNLLCKLCQAFLNLKYKNGQDILDIVQPPQVLTTTDCGYWLGDGSEDVHVTYDFGCEIVVQT